MQVTQILRSLAQKPGEIRTGIRLKIWARAERLMESWDFGYWHGLFAAEDGYVPSQQRPEAKMPNRYAEEMVELGHLHRYASPDWLTTGQAKYPTASRPAENIAGIEPIVVIKQNDPNVLPGATSREEQARQAEIDGLPGKAARLRGASASAARKVESPAEKQARRNKARIDREFASGKRTTLT